MAPARTQRRQFKSTDDERRQAERNNLADKLTVEAKVLADLKIEKATVEGERRTVEADLGPVRYLAMLIGAGDQNVLRWFTLVVALLLDPAVRRDTAIRNCAARFVSSCRTYPIQVC